MLIFLRDLFNAWKQATQKRNYKKRIASNLAARTANSAAKQAATEANEPWVAILSVDLDDANIDNGSFELDWNDTFVAKLVRAGYKGKTDKDIVDLWFQHICTQVANDTYGQYMADPKNRKELTDEE